MSPLLFSVTCAASYKVIPDIGIFLIYVARITEYVSFVPVSTAFIYTQRKRPQSVGQKLRLFFLPFCSIFFLVASVCDLPDIINCQFHEHFRDPFIFCHRTNCLEFTA